MKNDKERSGEVPCKNIACQYHDKNMFQNCGAGDDEPYLTRCVNYAPANIQQLLQPENVLPVCWNENCPKWSEDICQSPGKCIEDVSG